MFLSPMQRATIDVAAQTARETGAPVTLPADVLLGLLALHADLVRQRDEAQAARRRAIENQERWLEVVEELREEVAELRAK